MQVQLNIAFEQLLEIVKALPSNQLKRLKKEIDKKAMTKKTDLKELLLNGPVATKEELETIANNRKAINQWRAKK